VRGRVGEDPGGDVRQLGDPFGLLGGWEVVVEDGCFGGGAGVVALFKLLPSKYVDHFCYNFWVQVWVCGIPCGLDFFKQF